MKTLEFQKKVDPNVLGEELAGLIIPKSLKVSDAWDSLSVSIADEKDFPEDEATQNSARELADEQTQQITAIVEAHKPHRKRLIFTSKNDLSQLHDELLTLPELKSTGDPVLMVEGAGDKIVLTVPVGADEKQIEKIVKAHTPKPNVVPLSKKELQTRLGKANSVSELKEILGLVVERVE